MRDARNYVEDIGSQLNVRFGERLSTTRRLRGLSQSALAESVGFSRATIANLELGKQGVQLQQVYALAHALNTKVEELLPALEEVHSGHGSEADQFVNLAKLRLNILLGASA